MTKLCDTHFLVGDQVKVIREMLGKDSYLHEGEDAEVVSVFQLNSKRPQHIKIQSKDGRVFDVVGIDPIPIKLLSKLQSTEGIPDTACPVCWNRGRVLLKGQCICTGDIKKEERILLESPYQKKYKEPKKKKK